MNYKIKILFLWFCFFGSVNVTLAQQDTIKYKSFYKELKEIRLLTDIQQYSEAINRLKAIENSKEKSKEITATHNNEVTFRILVARVYRLSGEFDDAMNQMNLLPKLTEPDLLLKVNFRIAALYMENPKYTMEERIKIVYPIIDEGIRISKKYNYPIDLASYYSLKGGMHADECNLLKRNCKKNNQIAITYYKKSMELFLENNDTLNYHNCLNGLFRLAMGERTKDVDLLKNLVLQVTEKSTYAPNVLASRNHLGVYYLLFKKDSFNFLKQSVLEKDAMIAFVNKNADNAIGKLKVLYEFDSLKSNLHENKGFLKAKDLEIKQKNIRIIENIVFSIALAVLSLILILLFIKQKKLGKEMNNSNKSLLDSNHNFELLIKESNHRIKNNLQMILSIIELEKNNNEESENILLTNISSKILTIAALHRILDFKEHNQKVDLNVYFNEIIQYFEDLSKNEIEFSTDFTTAKIQSERIIYFGLIVNELISNTLEHRKSKGEIVIQVLRTENNYIFTYRDNSDFGDYTKNNGIALIENLIGRFGGSNFKFNPKFGEYKFYFNE